MAKVSKPLGINLIPHPFMEGGQQFLSFGCAIGFPMAQTNVVLAEVDVWQTILPVLGSQACIDLGFPKPQGEWLLCGKSHAPDHKESESWQAQVQIGSLTKKLQMHGPRNYDNNKLSKALPVTQVEMSWANTWGGPEILDNLHGCGTAQANEKVQVPCIEYPHAPWKSPQGHNEVAGVLPLDIQHPLRQKHIGTYDEDYLKKYFPGYAQDFNRQHFNLAPKDQQLNVYWKGNETYELKHWHPDQSLIQGKLPGLRCALWAAKKGQVFQSVPMQLSTVWFFPNQLTMVLVFHGCIDVDTLDGSDVERIITGMESMAQPAFDRDHYEAVWKIRTQRDAENALASLDDQTLMPPGWTLHFEALQKALEKLKNNPVFEKQNKAMKAHWQDALDKLEHQKNQLDSKNSKDAHVHEQIQKKINEQLDKLEANQIVSQPSQDIAELNQQFKKLINSNKEVLKTALAQTKHELADAKSKLNDSFSKLDSFKEEIAFKKSHLDDISAEKIKQQLNELNKLLATPSPHLTPADKERALNALKKIDEFLQKQSSQLQPDGLTATLELMKAYGSLAKPLPFDSNTPSIEEIEQWQASFEMPSFQQPTQPLHEAPTHIWKPNSELTNATGFKLDLKNRDLNGVKWRSMTMIDCDLSQSVLDKAELHQCHFIMCDFTGSQLKELKLHQVKFTACRLTHVQAVGMNCNESQFINCELDMSSFENSQWLSSVILKGSCVDTYWHQAQLKRTVFNEMGFGQSDFTSIIASGTAWIGCQLDKSTLQKSKLEKCNFVNSQMPKIWTQAQLSLMSLRGAKLNDSQWQEAKLDGVDMSEADLSGADFSKSYAKQVQWVHTNFTGAKFNEAKLSMSLFMHGNLQNTSFEKSQIENCWLGKTNNHEAIGLDSAVTTGSTFHPRKEVLTTP